MLLEEQIKEIVSGSAGVIKERVKEELVSSLVSQLSYNLRDQVSNVVSEFIKNEMTSEINTILHDSKEAIIEELQKGVVGCVGEVAKNMIATAQKNLASSWKSKDVYKALFE